MSLWVVALAANVLVALAYLAIGLTVLGGVRRSHQWRANPLAVATGAIFLTAGAGYGAHVEHLLAPSTAEAARGIYDWHTTILDLLAAAVGIRYWMLRGRVGALFRTTTLFDDVAGRRADAQELQEGIVQRLALAKMAFELGDTGRGMDVLEDALDASRELVTRQHDLSAASGGGGRPGPGTRPGDLRREEPQA